MKRFKLSAIGLMVGLFFISQIACAEIISPVTLMQTIANHLIQKLEQHKSQLKSRRVIDNIVNEVIIPHVATNIMAGSVVGRRYWMSATPAQRKKFVDEFKDLVISTYAAAFAAYNGDRIKFYPLRTDYKNVRYLRVRSLIIRKTGQKIPVDYNLYRVNETWKVYDFAIEHVSMVGSYRSQFAGVLSQSGMVGLIDKLTQRNRSR